MAREITSGELALLRSDNQWSRLYLAIHKPAVIYSARVNQVNFNDVIAEITYDGGSGTLANVLVGMTLYVGSSAGGHDKGMVRIRKAPSETKFYLGESAEVKWGDNDYLTVVDEFGLWSKHLRISDVTPLMDYDVVYSDQHSNLDPVPVMGSTKILWLTGATVSFTPDASSSWVLGSTITAYLWEAPGASTTSNLATATPTITYNAVGQYRISCKVTAENGKVTTGYRIVFVYSEAHPPITQFELKSCSGDLEGGGWSFGVSLYDESSLSDIKERAYCILFAKDYYGASSQSLGPVEDRENILAEGWITQETLEYSSEVSSGDFEIKGANFWLSKITGYPVGMEYSAENASAWTQMEGLTVDRALWHLLHWRSTATTCIDIFLSGDTRKAPTLEAPVGNLWTQIKTMAEDSILANVACDRYNRLFVDFYVSLMSDNDRIDVPVVMELTKGDFENSLSIERRIIPEVSLMETSGVSFNGTEATALFSKAPGKVISHFGNIESRERLLLQNQEQCNLLSGLLYANLNNEFPHVDLSLAQNNRFIDIIPKQRVTLSFISSDFPRGITWISQKLLPTRVEYVFQDGVIGVHLELEKETTGTAGVSHFIPPPAIIGNTEITIPPIESLSWPSIIPGGYTFPPYIYPGITPGNGDCPTDAPGNGPYSVGIYGVISSDQSYYKEGSINCIIRTSAHDNKTTYMLQATFQKLVSSDPAVYENTLDDDFYDVIAYSANGEVVAYGVHDPVTSPYLRTGVLNAINALQISKISVNLNSGELFRPSVVTHSVSSFAYATDLIAGDLTWGYWGKGIWAMVLNASAKVLYDRGAGGARSPGVSSLITFGGSEEFNGKTLLIRQRMWARMSHVIYDDRGGDPVFGAMVGDHYNANINYEKWRITYDPALPSPTFLLDSETKVFTAGTTPLAKWLTIKSTASGGAGGQNGQGLALTEIPEHLIYIGFASTYRITVSELTLYNVCPPETE